MKKLIVALLIATLCMVAPAAAFDWEILPFGTDVWIDPIYEPGLECGTYFDLYLPTSEEERGVAYPGWCVDTGPNAIRNQLYGADLSTTIGISEKYNKINWVLNHKGDATPGEIQVAIWKILGKTIPTRHQDWNTVVAQQLAEHADSMYVPTCYPEIGAVLVEPNGDWIGQPAIIEIPMPACPSPVPEFPLMMIPVFLVGSLTLAASVLKKE